MQEMIIITMIGAAMVLNWMRHQYQSNETLRYQFRFGALRDQLHREAIFGNLDDSTEAYRFLDYMLETIARQLPSMNNIWWLIGNALTSRIGPEEQAFRQSMESKIYAEPGCLAIYSQANQLWIESVRARHKYSLFAAATALMPIFGLAQLYQRYRNRCEQCSAGQSLAVMPAS
jgi:hypothetical protein